MPTKNTSFLRKTKQIIKTSKTKESGMLDCDTL